MDDHLVVKQIISGDNELFDRMVDKHYRMVFRVCMGFLHHREDAEDVTQDVFVNAYRSLERFKGTSSIGTWLYRIAVNRSITYLRSKRRHRVVELFSSLAPWPVVAPNHSDTPESHMAQTELQQSIRQAVDSLVDKQRIAFTLSKYEELPQAQIAEIMMISEGAVESLLQRAKINLQKKLTSLKNFNE